MNVLLTKNIIVKELRLNMLFY